MVYLGGSFKLTVASRGFLSLAAGFRCRGAFFCLETKEAKIQGSRTRLENYLKASLQCLTVRPASSLYGISRFSFFVVFVRLGFDA